MGFIIGIQQGYVPFPIGDGLFQNVSDQAAFTAIIGDLIQPLTFGKSLIFVLDAMIA